MSAGESKRILITGASSGLGEALARRLAADGHRLGLVARRAERLTSLAQEIQTQGGEALVLPADLSDSTVLPNLVSAMIDRFGGIDVFVNNAAIGLPEFFSRSQPEQLHNQVNVNFIAPMLLTRHALPCLLASRGIVINIGSATTTIANPVFGVYGATKAALAYWTNALRRELHCQGLRVCYVDLGPVHTGFFEAVEHLSEGRIPLGTRPAPDGIYNAVRDRPPAILTAAVSDAASQIARLVKHPRRRLTFQRRLIWPLRALGAIFGMVPGLGDAAVSLMVRRIERERARSLFDSTRRAETAPPSAQSTANGVADPSSQGRTESTGGSPVASRNSQFPA